jgi:hypothetical protein
MGSPEKKPSAGRGERPKHGPAKGTSFKGKKVGKGRAPKGAKTGDSGAPRGALNEGPTMNAHLLTLQRMAQSGPKFMGLYTNRQRILIVGEADFSFALALASGLGGGHIVATSLMRESQLQVTYGTQVSGTIGALARLGAAVYHGVDATALGDYEFMNKDAASRFSRIVWNFPDDAGPPEDDDPRAARSGGELHRKGRPLPKSKEDRAKEKDSLKGLSRKEMKKRKARGKHGDTSRCDGDGEESGDEGEGEKARRPAVNEELLGSFLSCAAG